MGNKIRSWKKVSHHLSLIIPFSVKIEQEKSLLFLVKMVQIDLTKKFTNLTLSFLFVVEIVLIEYAI